MVHQEDDPNLTDDESKGSIKHDPNSKRPGMKSKKSFSNRKTIEHVCKTFISMSTNKDDPLRLVLSQHDFWNQPVIEMALLSFEEIQPRPNLQEDNSRQSRSSSRICSSMVYFRKICSLQDEQQPLLPNVRGRKRLVDESRTL